MLHLLTSAMLSLQKVYVRDLSAQCQKHEANWIVVDEYLNEIEKDSTLSEVTNEALQKARQCVSDSLSLQTKVVKMQHIGSRLQASDFKTMVIILSL